MTINYRETDPVSGRWAATTGGIDLSAFQIDSNFYECEHRISTLEGNESITVSIASISITGDQITFTMTDSTTQGPFTIPQATFIDRGNWAPGSFYSVNDTFDENGTLYRVDFAHTSQDSFNPNANDGAGHNYYVAMLSTPGSSLPTGGATTQVMEKSSSTDFAVTWGWKLPTGGSAGQWLKKLSSTNQDAGWAVFPGVSAPPPSPGGATGQVVATRDGGSVNTEWLTVVSAPPPSPAGSAGAYLATADGTHTNMEWVSPPPAAALETLTDVNVTEGLGIDGFLLVWDQATLKWIAKTPEFTDTIQFVIDGGGATITTGVKGYLTVPFACTITANKLLADQSGSIVIDVWRCNYSQFDGGSTHPVVGDKITASAPPTITTSTKSEDPTLTGWSTNILAGDIFAYNVSSVTSIHRVTISLEVLR